MATLTLPIVALDPQTPEITLFGLDLGAQRFDYAAGQSVLVSVPGEAASKPFSLASSPTETERTRRLDLAVKRGDAGSTAPELHGLSPGDIVTIDGPYGRLTYAAQPVEPDLLFLAGGSGIAPLRGIIRWVVDRGGPERMTLIYSARTPADFAFAGELRALAASGRLRAFFTVTRDAGRRWPGLRGRIDEPMLAACLPSPRALCFICGPDAMLASLPPMLHVLGVAPDRIRTEEW